MFGQARCNELNIEIPGSTHDQPYDGWPRKRRHRRRKAVQTACRCARLFRIGRRTSRRGANGTAKNRPAQVRSPPLTRRPAHTGAAGETSSAPCTQHPPTAASDGTARPILIQPSSSKHARMGDTGLEPASVTTDKTNYLRQLNAQRAANCAAPSAVPTDPTAALKHSTSATPDLGRVINAWSSLPDSIRQRICGLAEAFELIAGGTASPDQGQPGAGQHLLVREVSQRAVMRLPEQEQNADANRGKLAGERSPRHE